MARRIRDEVDPFLIEVSLHGATAATHDRQTRVPGSFERLLANLREVAGPGACGSRSTARSPAGTRTRPRACSTWPTPWAADPDRPRGHAARRRRPRAAVDRADPGGSARGCSRSRRSGPEAQLQPSRAGATTAPCRPRWRSTAAPARRAWRSTPIGNVYPCVQWRRPVGNLHRQSIREIWTGSAGAARGARRSRPRPSGGWTPYGPSGGFLNFCPGSAAIRTGDPLNGLSRSGAADGR